MPDKERTLGMVAGDRHLHVTVRGLLGRRALCGAGRILVPITGKIESSPLACDACRDHLIQQQRP